MKKLLYCAAALATLLFAASCQQEKLEPVGGPVTFTVTAPGGLDTRAYADGENVNEVHWAVYRTTKDYVIDETDEIPGALAQGVVPMSNKTATVELDLLQDQYYTILFWAQVKDAGHYELGDLREVKIKYNPLYGNDESRAAFFQRHDFSTFSQQNYDVTLYRPFAQINLGTTAESLTPSQDGQTQGYTIDVRESKMTVKGLATSFDLLKGEGKDEAVEFTFNSTPTPAKKGQTLTVNDTDYHYIAMNYLIVPILDKTVEVSYEITTDKGVVTNTIGSVPVKENFRTNIIGNLLTSKTEFEIVVDKEFEVPEIVLGDSWTQTGSYQYTVNPGATQASLAEILAHADKAATEAATKADGPVVTIDLNGDVYWETEGGIGSSPLLPAESLISKVIINGNNKTFTATGAGVGSIRLANGGLLEFNKVNIVDESVSYNESAWELRYLEFAGNLAFSECTFNSGVQFETQGDESVLSATFDRCRFITNEESVYAVWVCDGTTTFTGCKFEGTRGLKMHEDYGSVIASVTVDGCTFGPLSEKPGIAIGSIREPGTSYTSGGTYTKPADAAVTSVTIKNSKFDRCQAGDQNNYMYESDTDVTTFNFVLENNEVVPSGDGVIDQGDGKTAAVANTESLADAIAGNYTTIKLAEGVYVIPDEAQGKTLTFIGTGDPEDTKIATQDDGSYEGCDYSLDGSTVTFENITINTDSETYTGYARCNGTYKNCIINGTYTLYGDSVFEDCTFNVSGDVYNIWTWGAPTATFTRCTFNSDGKAMLLYGTVNTELTVNECTFNDKGGLTDLKAAIEIGNDYDKSYTLVVDNTTVNGYEVNDKGIVTGTTLWANKNSMPTDKLSVTIDGLTWIGGRLYRDAQGNIIVNSAEALDEVDQYISEGTHNVLITEDLVGDATIDQAANTVINVNGQNHKYRGVITVNGKSATYTTAGLTIKDLTFDAETISADACIRLGDGTNATRYTCNVTVDNCTFDVPGAVGVKSYTGGDKNLTITGSTATAKAHSLIQAKGIDGVLIEKCNVYSKNGLNFNNSDNVTVDNCTADVKGYAARFGESAGGAGAAETYAIKNSTLKSACEDGDAVIILRGTADYATLTIEDTTLEGSIQLTNTAKDATVIIDGKAQKAASDQSSLESALTGDSEVTLGDGNYTLPSVSGGDVAINGTEDVVITITKPNYSGSDLTLNGVTVKGSGYSTGVQHVNTVTYNGVKVIGEMCLYGEKVVFNECTFELASGQYIWTYGAKEVEFIGCTFNTDGKAILVYNEGAGASKVTVKGCTFNATAGAKAGAIANQNCAAIEIDNHQNSGVGAAHVVITENNVNISNNFSGEWRIKNFVAGNPVTVDGVEYTQIALDGKLMTIDASKNVTVVE